MKDVIEEVFSAVVEYLMASWHVKLENCFVDGTKIEANANKHKVVWEKQRDRYHQKVKEEIKRLLKKIEAENEAEQENMGIKTWKNWVVARMMMSIVRN